MYTPGSKFYPFFDEPGSFVTSVDVLIIRDDGLYFDFSDSTFKDTGWTTKIQALTEKTEGVWVWATGWTIPSGNREYRALYKDNSGTLYPGERIIAGLPANFSSFSLANLDVAVSTRATPTQVGTSVDASLAAVNLDHLVGTATGIPAVPSGTYLDQMMDDGTAAFDRATDSLQAIRDRGDVAWITGGGGGISDILNIVPLVPGSVDLANTATWRLGLVLTNALADLPTTAEITPGTISIERKAIGGTAWSAVVTDAACSESAGLIYYDATFNAAAGYAEGDSIRVTLKSQSITVAATVYEISDAVGRIFYTTIRQAMRGTDNAALASVCTEARLSELDAATGGKMANQVDVIETDTNDLQTRVPAALVGGKIDANVGSIDGSAACATNLRQSTLGIVTGVAGSGSTTTSLVTSSMSPAAVATDQFKGKIVTFAEDTTTTALRGQSTDITANTAVGVLTVTALTTAPVSGDTFSVT